MFKSVFFYKEGDVNHIIKVIWMEALQVLSVDCDHKGITQA